MGNTEGKISFRKSISELTSRADAVDVNEEKYWRQFWGVAEDDSQDSPIERISLADVFALVVPQDVRDLRERCPRNFLNLCFKLIEQIQACCNRSVACARDREIVMNCVRLLTRIMPFFFEDEAFRNLLWAPPDKAQVETRNSDNVDAAIEALSLKKQSSKVKQEDEAEFQCMAVILINSLCDLLFCPELTVVPLNNASKKDHVLDDLYSLDTCELIWEAGVGCAYSRAQSPAFDQNRAEILKLILTCFSETIYLTPKLSQRKANRWVQHLTSKENRNHLPLFTSLLNVVFAYDPSGYVPYNHLLFSDFREPLVDVALQVLIVALDDNCKTNVRGTLESQSSVSSLINEESRATKLSENLFITYLSRVYRDEDFRFILNGFKRLLNNPLVPSYLPNSCKRVKFHQELLILFWKCCDINKKFICYILKSSDVLDIVVPILYHLCDAKSDPSHMGLIHIGVFILLLLSGERNFGVRLNKPYSARVPMDIPMFSGTHGDLLIIVFHRLMTSGHSKIQNLFDSLLTVVVNVSPYLKSLSMVAANKILHLFEAFSTPWFLFANENNHHLIFFLLEVFNNIIQYQFDGNSNLVYCIIRKRNLFHQLANLPVDNISAHVSMPQYGLKAMKTPQHQASAPASANSKKTGENKAKLLIDMDALEDEAARAARDIITTPQSPLTMTNDIMGHNNSELVYLAATPAVDKMTTTGTAHEMNALQGKNAFLFSGESLDHEGGDVPYNETDCNEMTGLGQMASSSTESELIAQRAAANGKKLRHRMNSASSIGSTEKSSALSPFVATSEWAKLWKEQLPLQTVMRLLQVLVPQVEKICIDRSLSDEGEIIKFLKNGTLVGLLPVPHPILIRKYQANEGTNAWFRTYLWAVIYLRNGCPPIWVETRIRLFETGHRLASARAR